MLIAVSCSAIGISASKGYKERTNGIKDFIGAFQIAKAEIVFKNASIPEVCQRIEQQCNGAARSFFGKKLDLKDDSVINDSNDIFLELKKYCFKEKEINVIKDIVSVLGRYDKDSLLNIIDKGIIQLDDLHKNAQIEQEKNGRLSAAFGITCGIVLAVLAF